MFDLRDYSLRPIEESDLAKVSEWRNSDRIRLSSFSEQAITAEQLREWFESLAGHQRQRHLIFEKSRTPIGAVNFVDVAARHGTAHWGLYLGEENQPKGTGTVLGYCGLEYGFNALGLRKVVAEVIESNPKSLSLHRRLGFIQEGRYRAHVLKNGVYQDVLSLALFADDWRAVRRPALGAALFSVELQIRESL